MSEELKKVTLLVAHNGYKTGELTGEKVFYRYAVRLYSGLIIYLYDDEFTYD